MGLKSVTFRFILCLGYLIPGYYFKVLFKVFFEWGPRSMSHILIICVVVDV